MPPSNAVSVISRLRPTIVATRQPFICFHCRLRANTLLRFDSSTQHRTLRTRPHISEPSPAERSQNWLGNKIWGKNNPLPRDPYSRPSAEEAAQVRQEIVGGPRERLQVEPEAPQEAVLASEESEQALQEEEEEYEEETEVYVPATTWDGLKSFKPSEWDAQAQYKGFVSVVKTQERQDVELAIQRACVEIYALKQDEHDIDLVYKSTSPFDASGWKRLCAETSFERLPNGKMTLKFANEETRMVILDSMVAENAKLKQVQKNIESSEDGIDAEEGAQQFLEDTTSADDYKIKTGLHDQTWRDIPLADAELKFALLKRTCQLLGLRIPDPQIAKIDNTQSLLETLLKKSKPKKLVEEIGKDGRLEGLKNLQVVGRRYSVIDREEEVGRLKLVEKELLKRRLPIRMR